MSEKTTVARPYAQAIFELAQAAGALPHWSEMLAFAAAVATDPDMVRVLDNPRMDRQRIEDLFLEVCGTHLDATGQNAMRVLAANRRLGLLPEIHALYEKLRAEAEHAIDAELISARPVSDEQRERIASALSSRLGREVRLVCKTDEGLLGGAVIRAGDLVIDGSALGRLNKLASALSHA